MYQNQNEESVVIALEVEKAFDYIEWRYMLTSLKYFGFVLKFIKLIEVIYAHPQASVITNGDLSHPFHLHLGVSAKVVPVHPICST